MNTRFEIHLEQSLPKRPRMKDNPQQILRTVVNARTGQRWSLRKFCALPQIRISYQGCIEQINRKPKVSFMRIVAEMRARARRKEAGPNNIHGCPFCRCKRVRPAESNHEHSTVPDEIHDRPAVREAPDGSHLHQVLSPDSQRAESL